MERQFLNPNWHVVLIHYPLGLLTIGLLVELFSFLWPRHSFRWAGHWMILLGTLLAVPAALSGVYALWDVANPTHDEATWKEIVAAGNLSDPQWKMLINHLRLMAIATGLSVVAVVTWMGSSDQWRRRLHVPLLIILCAGVGLLIAGSWFGGETVYTQGTAVKLPPTTMEGLSHFQQKMEYFASPWQLHPIMAGAMMSIAFLSLGLSFRKLSQPRHFPPQMDHIAAALESSSEQTTAHHTLTHWTPAARFWLLASLLAVLTAAGGFYLLVESFGIDVRNWKDVQSLWPQIQQHQRLMAHLIAGLCLIVLPLILASLARWAYQQRLLLAVFSLLLLTAVGVQVWLGILLLVDTGQGVATHFNR